MTANHDSDAIARAFRYSAVAIRRETDPPIPGEPFVSLARAIEICAELLAKPAPFNPLVDKLTAEQSDEVERAMTGRKPAPVMGDDAELIERLEGRLAETKMLAFKWMEAHDKLHAGKPYEFPKPADLPNAIQQLSAEVRRLTEKLRLKIEDADPIVFEPNEGTG